MVKLGARTKKFFTPWAKVEVANKGSHEAGFAYAGSQGETEGGEISFKFGEGGEFVLNGSESGNAVAVLLGG